MTIYLGPAGSLQSLPYMGRGIGASLDLGAVTQRALGGARTVDYVGDPKRTYSLDRKYLTADELAVIEGLALGIYGANPLILMDPWRRNQLTANQSSAGDALAATTGFTSVVGSLALGSTALAGIRSIAYTSPAAGAATSADIRIGDISSAAAIQAVGGSVPVLPSTAYRFFSGLIHVSGTAQPWLVGIRWYTSAGASVGSTTLGSSLTASGSWQTLTVTGTSPSTAAYAAPFVANSAILTATETIAVDQLQFEVGSVANAWTLGTGVPRVAFTSIGASYPMSPYIDASIELQEVG